MRSVRPSVPPLLLHVADGGPGRTLATLPRSQLPASIRLAEFWQTTGVGAGLRHSRGGHQPRGPGEGAWVVDPTVDVTGTVENALSGLPRKWDVRSWPA
jgi:hypothetical protein